MRGRLKSSYDCDELSLHRLMIMLFASVRSLRFGGYNSARTYLMVFVQYERAASNGTKQEL